MKLALRGPAKVIQDLEQIARHLRRAIPHDRLVRGACAAVVEHEHGVPVPSLVAKVLGLRLPVCFHETNSTDELQRY